MLYRYSHVLIDSHKMLIANAPLADIYRARNQHTFGVSRKQRGGGRLACFEMREIRLTLATLSVKIDSEDYDLTNTSRAVVGDVIKPQSSGY